MKNPERVAALLAELRTLAESDFERHRIDVLERDLHEPPTVEVIDDTHQRFDGVIYLENQKGHFQKSKQIHRDVWQYFNGEIPDDYVIHHVDGNPANNNIENLRLLTKNEHTKIHGYPLIEIACQSCGKVFQTRRRGAKFCSISCAAQFQFKGHSEEKTCPICGKIFHTRNSRKSVCCSIACAAELKRKTTPKVCPICGKTLDRKTGAKCCSHSCGAKLAWLTRKANQ